jgi:hypothetical protein
MHSGMFSLSYDGTDQAHRRVCDHYLANADTAGVSRHNRIAGVGRGKQDVAGGALSGGADD